MARPTKHAQRYKNVGRKTIMTPEVISKLEEGYSYSYTDEEACIYADISTQTLYKYQKKNPAFVERKKELQQKPNLSAKKVLASKIESDINQARWWAEKKLPEFAPKMKVEGSIMHAHAIVISPGMQQALETYNQTRRLQIEQEIKEMQ